MKGLICILLALLLCCAPKAHRTQGVYHVVKRHETLWRICKTYGVDMEYVARINGIRDPSKIRVGQRIFIPGATRVLDVKVPTEDIIPRRGSKVKAKPHFIWPVKGRLIRGFSQKKGNRHDGIDIAAPLGTPIKAAASGRVVYSDEKLAGYGKLVIIEHPGNYYTIYAHNSINLVKEEQWVKQGEVIAKVGKSGNAKGPHLHFEIRKGSKPLNPMSFLP